MGDRILSVNGQELVERTLEEVNQLLRDAKPYCVLEIEFDVTGPYLMFEIISNFLLIIVIVI